MNLSTRESNLLALTAIVILTVSGYLLAERALDERSDTGNRINEFNEQIARRQAVIAQTGQWDGHLRELRETLPSYPEEQDVTSQLLNLLESAARQRNLTLLRRDPERERRDGELYELTINCRWRGNLESLVYFLFDLQQKGVQLGVRQLSVTPRAQGLLEGAMTIDGAYSRHAVTTETADITASANLMGEPNQ